MEKTVTPLSTRERFHNLKQLALKGLGAAGLLASPLIIACSPDAKATHIARVYNRSNYNLIYQNIA